MSQDWYKRNVAPRGPSQDVAALEPTRFVIGPDGRAYPVAQDGLPPAQQQLSQQYPQHQQVQPWNRPPMQGDAPLGQIHVAEGLTYWRGSRDANAADAGRCPGCGSPNYFASLRAESDTGGESGKLSLGHCADCGWRANRRGAPSMQSHGSLRGISTQGAGAIPIEQARTAASGNRDAYGRQSGGFQVVQKIS